MRNRHGPSTRGSLTFLGPTRASLIGLVGRRLVPVLATVLVLALAACAAIPVDNGIPEGSEPPPAGAPATTAPATTIGPPATPGAPGALISADALDGAPGMRLWRLAYHSRDVDDRDIAVTGLLVAPELPATSDPTAETTATGPPASGPPTDIPLITYGHPTTGSADACAPSRGGLAAFPTPAAFTRRGWAVVMSDFPGLGTSDPHAYLVGASEGHSLLDAARAAHQVAGSGVTTRSPVAIVGFSQGGHAAAFAAQLAPTYAPELAIDGVALAAPVSDVDHFTARAEGMDDQLGVVVTIVGGYAHAYPELDPATVFTPTVVSQLGELEQRCIGEINTFFDRPSAEVILKPATQQEAYQRRFAENRAGGAPIVAPVLVVQGSADPTINPADSHALVERYCRLGATVQEVVVPGANHGVMAEQPYADWLTARFAGQAAPSSC